VSHRGPQAILGLSFGSEEQAAVDTIGEVAVQGLPVAGIQFRRPGLRKIQE